MHDPIYRQRIIDHYRHPRHFGVLKKPTHAFGYANISCGDSLQFQVRIESNTIKELGFTGEGCAVSIAGASLLSEYLIDKPAVVIKNLAEKDIEKLMQIPVTGARAMCAMLGLDTLKQLKKISAKSQAKR